MTMLQKGVQTNNGEEYGYTVHIFGHNKYAESNLYEMRILNCTCPASRVITTRKLYKSWGITGEKYTVSRHAYRGEALRALRWYASAVRS
jgi:hypothetical protein